MKKHQLANKALSVLLAAVMCFSNVQPYATMAYGEEVLEQQSDAEPVPETAAPETSAPETSAPETAAPETAAPETAAPETAAPETAAPETAAPETAAPETAAPGTEAVTEAPATEQTPATEVQPATETVPQTEAQSESESESESETEILMPAVVLTQTMEDGTVITVDAPEDAFPEGVQMQVTVINPWDVLAALLREKGYSAGDAQQLASELIASKDVRVRDYVAAYDISFYLPKEGNKEIEPAKKVEVTFSNVDVEAKKKSQIETFHIEDNGEATKVDAHNPSIDAAGNVEATVKTDSFSIYVVDGDVDAMLGMLYAADGESSATFYEDLSVFDKGTFTITDADGNVTENFGKPGDKISVSLDFRETPEKQFHIADFNDDGTVDLQTMYFNLPSGMNWNWLSTQTYTWNIQDPSTGTTFPVICNLTPSFDTNPPRVELKFQCDTSDPASVENLRKASEASNMHLTFSASGTLLKDSDAIPFGDDMTFFVDNTSTLKVGKTFEPDAVRALVDADPSLRNATAFTAHVMQATESDDKTKWPDFIRNDSTKEIVYTPKDISFTYQNILDGNGVFEIPYLQATSDEFKHTISEESVPTISGYHFISVNTSVDGNSSTSFPVKKDVDLELGDTKSISFANIYAKDVGNLKIKKVITGDIDPAADISAGNKTHILFHVTSNKGYDKTYKYAEFTNNELTLTGLEPAIYTVTETVETQGEIPGFTRTTTYEVNGSEGQSDEIKSDGQTIEITVKNDYKEKVGDLEIKKDVQADDKVLAALNEQYPDWKDILKFTLKDSKGNGVKVVKASDAVYHAVKEVSEGGETKYVYTSKDGRTIEYDGDVVKDAVFKYSDMVGDKVTVLGLRCVTYQVLESGMKFTGFNRTSTATTDATKPGTYNSVANSVDPIVAKATVVDNATRYAGFTNLYKIAGKLKVTKSIAGERTYNNLTEDQRKAITFALYKKGENVDGVQQEDQLIDTKTLAQFNSSSKPSSYEWTGLEFGDYYVVETCPGIDDYEVVSSFKVGSGSSKEGKSTIDDPTTVGTASQSTAPVIAFTNTYTHHKGKLTVSKTLDVSKMNADDQDKPGNTTVFTIKNGNSTVVEIKYKDVVSAVGDGTTGSFTKSGHTITVTKNGDNSYSFTIDNLDIGENYSVLEQHADVDTYHRDTKVSVDGAESTIADKAENIEVMWEGKADEEGYIIHDVAFDNAYKPLGKISVTKTWGPILSQDYYDNVLLGKLIFDVYRVGTGEGGSDELIGSYTYAQLTAGISVAANEQYYVIEQNAGVEGYTHVPFVWITDETMTTPAQHKAAEEAGVGNVHSANADVNHEGHTVFHYRNSYETVGPGEGTVFYKSYAGEISQSDIDEYIAPNILLAIRQYTDKNKTQLVGVQYKLLKDCLGEQGIKLAKGHYYISELPEYWKNGSGDSVAYSPTKVDGWEHVAIANGDDLCYSWSVIVETIGVEPKTVESFDVSNAANNEIYLEITRDTVKGLSYTNRYDPYGALTVIKNFEGLTEAQINSIKNNVTFTIDHWGSPEGGTPGWYTYKSNLTIDDFTEKTGSGTSFSWKLVLEKIPLGNYRVTETIGKEVTSYTRTSYISVSSPNAGLNIHHIRAVGKTATGSDGTTATVISTDDEGIGNPTVVKGKPEDNPTVTFDNEYVGYKGHLKVIKNFTGAQIPPEKKNIVTFTVTRDKKQIKQFTYADFTDGAYTIDDLPVGTYTVTETNTEVPGYKCVSTVTIPGNTTPGTKASQTITSDGQTITFTFNNEYKAYGKLWITKAFVPTDVAGLDKAKNDVKFTVKKKDGTIARDINGKEITFTYKNILAEAQTVDGVAGLSFDVTPDEYVVTEQGQDFADSGFAFIHAYAGVTNPSTDPVEDPMVSVTVEQATQNDANKVIAAFKNEYAETGSLKITKQLIPSTYSEEQANAIQFTIFNVENADNPVQVTWNQVTKDNVTTNNYAVDGQGTKKSFTFAEMKGTPAAYEILDLPAGKYMVKEEVIGESADVYAPDNPFPGLTRTTTYVVNTGSAKTGTEAQVTVDHNGSTVAYTNKYENVTPMVADKGVGGPPTDYLTIDGVRYPYWTFTLTVSDLRADAEIVDTFDVSSNNKGSWFDLVTDANTLEQITGTEVSGDEYPFVQLVSGTKPKVTIDKSEDNKATFNITEVDHTKASKIIITYYFIAKDLEAIKGLHSNNSTTSSLEWTFTNQIAYKPTPTATEPVTDTVDYTYVCAPVQKQIDEEHNMIISDDSTGNTIIIDKATGQETTNVWFKLTLNPDGQSLGEDPTALLTAYDTLSPNLSVNLRDITCDVEGVKWDRCDCTTEPKHTLHFWDIPNATPVHITYRATIIEEGPITISNTVTMVGYQAVVSQHIVVTQTGSGEASLACLNLTKYGDNAAVAISGVEFEMWDDEADKRLYKFKTQENGYYNIWYGAGDGEHPSGVNITPDHRYHIHEIVPVGYTLPAGETGDYYFIVTEDMNLVGNVVTVDGKKYIYYMPGGELEIHNTPFSTTVDLGAKKTLVGRDLNEGDFTFRLTQDGNIPTTPTHEVSNDGDGKANFGTITYKTSDLTPITETVDGHTYITGYGPKEFTYHVKEVIPDDAVNPSGTRHGDDPDADGPWVYNGVTYDSEVKDVVVKVSLNADKTGLVTEVTGATKEKGGTIYFVGASNEYNAEGEKQFSGNKTLEGRNIKAGDFTFELDLQDANKTKIEVSNPAPSAANGYTVDFDFPLIKYVTDDGTNKTSAVRNNDGTYTVTIDPDLFNKNHYIQYTYKVTEKQGNQGGVTYNIGTKTYDITVRVTDNLDGTLTVKAFDSTDAEITDFKSLIKFENKYNAEGENKPEGKKSLKIEDQELPVEAGQFEFNVLYGNKEIGKVTNTAGTSQNPKGTINYPTIKAIVNPDADATGMSFEKSGDYLSTIVITCKNIEDFEKAGYTFKFNEVNGGETKEGILYGNEEYTVKATIAANPKDESNLIVSLDKATGLDFVNTTFGAEGEDTPSGTKKLNKDAPETAYDFTVSYKGTVLATVHNIISGQNQGNINYPKFKVVLDAKVSADSVVYDSVQNIVTITSNKLDNLRAGYDFVIAEVNGGKKINGVDYDDETYTLNVKADLNAKDATKLDVTLSDNSEALNFVNTTYGAEGQDTPAGFKSVPKSVTLKDGAFTFLIYNGEIEPEEDPIGKVTNNADGTIKYPVIKFVLDKTVTATTVTADSEEETGTITIKANNLEDLGNTYTFTIVEENGGEEIDGFVYADKKYVLTASAAEDPADQEKLIVTLSDNAKSLNFVNTTYRAVGEDTPEGTKSVPDGVTMRTFTFLISYNKKQIGKVTNSADGKINYPTIKFVLDKTAGDTAEVTVDDADNTKLITVTANNLAALGETFTFDITEENGGEKIDGILYYEGTVTLEASATENSSNNKKLDVKLSDNAKKLDFVNTDYKAEGEDTPKGKKTLKGKLLKAGEFIFEIKYGTTTLGTFSHEQDGTINYPTIKFVLDPAGTEGVVVTKKSGTYVTEITVTGRSLAKLAKEYSFEVSEQNTGESGISYYDPHHLSFTATAAENPDVPTELKVTLSDAANLDFLNKATSGGGSDRPHGTKELLGRNLKDEEFTFVLKSGNDVLGSFRNKRTGEILYPEFKYVVDPDREASRTTGYDTDGNLAVVTVTVKEATDLKAATYTVSERKGNADGITYDETTVQKITVTPTVDPNDDAKINVKAVAEEGKKFVNYYRAEGEKSISGTKALKNRLPKDGEFQFEIYEVTVKDDVETRTLIGTVQNTGTTINYPTFKYVVDPEATATSTVMSQDGKTIVVTVKNVEDLANGFKYSINEVDGKLSYIGYSTKIWDLDVTVEPSGTNAAILNVSISKTADLDFINDYSAEGSMVLEAKKTLVGRLLNTDDFEYELKDSTGKVLQRKKNAADTSIVFDKITYTLADMEKDENGYVIDTELTYTVKEVVPEGGKKDGVLYDDNEYKITVTLHDMEDGNINVTVGEDLENVVKAINAKYTFRNAFENYYDAVGEDTISGTKVLRGRTIKEDEFSFEIKDSDGNVLATVKNRADGSIKYPTFKFAVKPNDDEGYTYNKADNVIIYSVKNLEKMVNAEGIDIVDGVRHVTYSPKEYTFTVTEVPEDENGVTYNENQDSYTLTAKVGVNAEDAGILDVTIAPTTKIDFTNTYRAKGSSGNEVGNKKLKGRRIVEKEFVFEIKDSEGTVLGTVTNDAFGKITYPIFTYIVDPDLEEGTSVKKDDDGNLSEVIVTYNKVESLPTGNVTYTVVEVIGDKGGVTYDNEFNDTVNVTVKVAGKPEETDKKYEKLDVNAKRATDPDAAFKNYYDAEGENTVSGTKTLRGRKIKEGEYKFTISDDEGEVIATVSNKADGTINYPTFKYVVDHAAAEDTVVFDDKSNTIIKTVDELEEMLTPVGEPGTDIPVSWDPMKYTYTVAEVIPDDAVDANGTRYADRKEDDKGPYTLSGVTYNTEANKYDLTVTVSLNEKDQGILDVAIEPNEKLDFVNLYKAKGEATVSGKKILECADIANYEGAFQFTITDSDGNVITTVKNDIQGVIQYPTFRYIVDPDLTAGAVYDADTNVYTVTVNAYEDLKAVYTYKVDEVQLEDETMAYNVYEDSYELKVTVKANEKDAAILDVTIPDSDDLSFTNRQYYFAGVAKIDAATKKDLKGAVLQLVASNGKVVEEWTTDGSTHLINLLSIEPGTYSFREKSAPKGYKLAETITFTVDKEGNVSSKTKFKVDKENNSIFTMKDERETPRIPKTGDTSNVFEWMLTMILALAAAIVLVIARRRRRAVR